MKEVGEFMPINIEEIVERAFEHAFAKSLEQILQAKAEALFAKAISNGSPLSKKLEEKVEQGFDDLSKKAFVGKRKKLASSALE